MKGREDLAFNATYSSSLATIPSRTFINQGAVHPQMPSYQIMLGDAATADVRELGVIGSSGLPSKGTQVEMPVVIAETVYGIQLDYQHAWLAVYDQEQNLLAWIHRQAGARLTSDALAVLSELRSLLDKEESNDDLRPTVTVFKEVTRLMLEAALLLSKDFPKPNATYADSHGGLRIEWTRADREVRLAFPPPPERPYIYHEFGDAYAVDHDMTVAGLVRWLKWLIE